MSEDPQSIIILTWLKDFIDVYNLSLLSAEFSINLKYSLVHMKIIKLDFL